MNRSGAFVSALAAGLCFSLTALPSVRPAAAQAATITSAEFDTMWMAGPAQMAKLAAMREAPEHAGAIVRFAMAKLSASWRSSSFTNEYKPIVDAIAAAHLQFKEAGPDAERKGNQLLYDACNRIAQMQQRSGVTGSVPEHVYSWLKGQ
jgi:hypothetical protein